MQNIESNERTTLVEQKRPINKKPLYFTAGCGGFFLILGAIFLIIAFVKEQECIRITADNINPLGDTFFGNAIGGGLQTPQLASECYDAITLFWCSVIFFGLSLCGCCMMSCLICGYAFS